MENNILKDLHEKMQRLYPRNRYFLCSEKAFDKICTQLGITHVEIRYYRLAENLWLKILNNMWMFTSPSFPDDNDTMFEAKYEFVKGWLEQGEYLPETKSWTGVPIRV